MNSWFVRLFVTCVLLLLHSVVQSEECRSWELWCDDSKPESPKISWVNSSCPSDNSDTRPLKLQVGESHTFKATATDSNKDINFVKISADGQDYNEKDSCQIACGSQTASITYRWDKAGFYTVIGYAEDDAYQDDVVHCEVSVIGVPKIEQHRPSDNLITLNVGQSQTFEVTATDPNLDIDYIEIDGSKYYCNSSNCRSHSASKRKSWNQPGTYHVTAIAVDKTRNASNAIRWKVEVSSPPPPQISWYRSCPSTLKVGQSYTFEAKATDSDGDIDYVEIDGSKDNCRSYCSSHSASQKKSWDKAGSYTITALVLDKNNQKDTVTCRVNVTSASPTISRRNPRSQSITVELGERVTFEAFATDEDGNIDYVKIYSSGQSTKKDSCSSGCDSHTADTRYKWEQAGNYVVKAIARDDEGLESRVIEWNVIVKGPQVGDLGVVVHNVAGANPNVPKSNAIVELYKAGRSVKSQHTTDINDGKGGGQTIFRGLTADSDYAYKVYHNSGTLFGKEYWGQKTNVAVLAYSTTQHQFERNQPYVSNVSFQEAIAGKVTAKITVKNPGSTTQQTKVRLVLDRDKRQSYDCDRSTSPRSVSGYRETVYEWICKVPSSGNYYYAVSASTYHDSDYLYHLTDSSAWLEGPKITIPIIPGILQFYNLSYSAQEGDTMNIKVIRSNGSDGTVSVQYASNDDTATVADADYTEVSGTLSWNSGDSSSKSFKININPDNEVETEEELQLILSNPTGGATLHSKKKKATITIVDKTTLIKLQLTKRGQGVVNFDPEGTSCGDGCQQYPQGTEVNLTAQPKTEYSFDHWEEHCQGRNSSCRLTLDTNKSVTAVFEPHKILSVTTSGCTVTSSPTGLNCRDDDCEERFPHNTPVTLTVTPNENQVFEKWTEDCSGNQSDCQVQMSENRNVIANCVIPENLLQLQIQGNGQVRLSPEGTPAGKVCQGNCEKRYASNASVTLIAEPDENWCFENWTGSSCSYEETASCRFSMTTPQTMTANFYSCPNTYTLTVSPQGQGTVKGSIVGDASLTDIINCGTDGQNCTKQFEENVEKPQTVSLTQTPDEGYYFVGWREDCSENALCDVMMTQKRNVTAIFEACHYSFEQSSNAYEATEDTGSVKVSAPEGCSWSVISDNTWLTITSGNTGQGNGSVPYSVTENTETTSRKGTFTLEGQTFTVTQEGIVDDVINKAPIASFTYKVEGMTVYLDASDSSDPDGTISHYAWSSSDGQSTSGKTAQLTFSTDEEDEEYNITLTLTDNKGKTGTISKTVTFITSPPVALFTPDSDPISGIAPFTVELNATGSYDPDGGNIKKYDWSSSNGQSASGNKATMTFNGGNYSISLKITDDEGQTATLTKEISVNQRPIAMFTATPDQGKAPLTVQLASTSSDPDGDKIMHHWTSSDKQRLSGVNPTITFTEAGEYSLSLFVKDSKGAESKTASTNIFVGVPSKTLKIMATGKGGVINSSEGINCRDKTCSKKLTEGQSITLTAKPDNPTDQVVWTGCSPSSNGLECEVVMDGDKNVDATFIPDTDPNSQTTDETDETDETNKQEGETGKPTDGNGNTVKPPVLTLTLNGSGYVSLDGRNCRNETCTKELTEGQSITLTASPDNPITDKVVWTGCSASNEFECEVEMNGPQTVKASIGGGKILIVTLEGEGSGKVSGQGFNCSTESSSECTHRITDPLLLTATASQGSIFGGWKGEACQDSKTVSCQVALSKDKNQDGEIQMTALFESCTYEMTFSQTHYEAEGGKGEVSINAPKGCEWKLETDQDWLKFNGKSSGKDKGSVKYTVAPNTGPDGRTVQLSLAGQKQNITQGSTGEPKHTLKVKKIGKGSVKGTPGINCGTQCSNEYSEGATLDLTAEPIKGYSFISWQGAEGCDTETTCRLTITDDQEVTAKFQACQYTFEAPSRTHHADAVQESVELTTLDNCEWTVEIEKACEDWLTVTSETGQGKGKIPYLLSENAGDEDRSCPLRIGDKKLFTIKQLANQAPTATFVTESSFYGTVPLTLVLESRAEDADGTIEDYRWISSDGQSLSGESVEITYGKAGRYILSHEVVDNRGAISRNIDLRFVVVKNEPQPPVARFTLNPESGKVPLTLDLDGRKSSDDGKIISYYWESSEGQKSLGRQTTLTLNQPGTVVISLTVVDNEGLTGTVEQTVVVEPEPEALIADFTVTPSHGIVPLEVRLDAAQSSPQSEIVQYEWSTDGQKDSGRTAKFEFEESGIKTIVLIITDKKKRTSRIEKTVIVKAKPIARFKAIPNVVKPSKPVVQLDASETFDPDPDDVIVKYIWTASNGKTASGEVTSMHFDKPGQHEIELIVVDSDGLSSVSAKQTITVMPEETAQFNPIAIIDAEETDRINRKVRVNGNRSRDIDGRIEEFIWTTSDGQKATGKEATLKFAKDGEYSVTLKTVDNDGLTGEETKTLTVGEVIEISIEGHKPFYRVGDPVKIDLVENVKVKSRFHRVDLWVAVALPNKEFRFKTPLGLVPFNKNPQPFKTALEKESGIHRLFSDFDVVPGLGGEYVIYAVYVEAGKHLLTESDTLGILRSNVVQESIILANLATLDDNIRALKRYAGLAGVDDMRITEQGEISLTLNGTTLYGRLLEPTIPGTPPSDGSVKFNEIDDINQDGLNDYEVIYPTGDRQTLLYFGTEKP